MICRYNEEQTHCSLIRQFSCLYFLSPKSATPSDFQLIQDVCKWIFLILVFCLVLVDTFTDQGKSQPEAVKPDKTALLRHIFDVHQYHLHIFLQLLILSDRQLFCSTETLNQSSLRF